MSTNDPNAGTTGSGGEVVFIVVALGVLALAVWLAGHTALVTWWDWVKRGEIWMIRGVLPGRFVALQQHLVLVQREHLLSRVHWATITEVNHRVGTVLGPVLAVPLGVLAIRLFWSRYQRTRVHTPESLVETVKERFPWGRVWNHNIHLQDPHAGPWALAQRPWDFARAHQAAYWEPDADHPDAKLHMAVEAAERALIAQLGPTDLALLPVAVRALVAALLPQVHGDDETTHQRLSDLANLAYDHADLRGVVRMQAVAWTPTPAERRIWDSLVVRHRFARCQFLALFEAAGERALLPSAHLLWLKAVDRPLWYAVNSLGRGHRCHVEGAGILAHYRTECAAGVPLLDPQIDDAVHGLRAALQEVRE